MFVSQRSQAVQLIPFQSLRVDDIGAASLLQVKDKNHISRAILKGYMMSRLRNTPNQPARSQEPTRRRATRGRRVPSRQFADPWSFRAKPAGRERIADHSGKEVDYVQYRQGGTWLVAASQAERHATSSTLKPERSMLSELRRRFAAEISRYRTSGLLSAADLELIEALWAGTSLRAYARRRGVTPAAINDHIDRLQTRAHRFWLWWATKNRTRRGLR
jgi:hypothetical protein